APGPPTSRAVRVNRRAGRVARRVAAPAAVPGSPDTPAPGPGRTRPAPPPIGENTLAPELGGFACWSTTSPLVSTSVFAEAQAACLPLQKPRACSLLRVRRDRIIRQQQGRNHPWRRCLGRAPRV